MSLPNSVILFFTPQIFKISIIFCLSSFNSAVSLEIKALEIIGVISDIFLWYYFQTNILSAHIFSL